MSKFEGVYANLPTPFDDAGEKLDFQRLHSLIDFILESGVHGIACQLSSGEYPYLSHEERKRLAGEVVNYVSGRVPVLVGVSALTTAEAIDLTVHAEALGAAAGMVMPLQFWPLKRHEVIAHFKRISRASPLPLGIYDNPRLGAAPFTGEMYKQLSDEANVQLCKDSSGDITRVLEVSRLCGDKVAILHGDHMQMLAAYLFGAGGVCTAIAAVFPSVCLELYHLSVVEKRWEEARRVFAAVEPIFRFFHEHSLARCVKEASQLMGRPLGAQRAPLSGLSADERQRIRELLERHGYLPASRSDR